MQFSRVRIRQAFQSLLLAAVVAGCDHGATALVSVHGEDSWAHYKGGGLFLAGSPTISPDGATIVYSTPCSGRGDIVRVNRVGASRVKLAGSEDYEAHPIFSPDGSCIAYVREHDGDRHIWVMRADGTGHIQLTTGRVMDDVVGFSADGARIFFDRSLDTGGDGKFPVPYSMRFDGKDLGRTSTKSEDIVRDGVATPDGKRTYFVSRPYGRDLCVRESDGSGERVISAPRGYKLPPRLSRDGRTLLLGVYTGGKRNPDVVLIDVIKEEVIGQFSEDCDGERVPESDHRDRPGISGNDK